MKRNDERVSFAMNNWLEKLEDKQDKLLEEKLNIQLQKLIDLADNIAVFERDRMIQVFEKILNVYCQLEKNNYEYDKKDAIFRKKKLAEMRYEKLKKDDYESKDSQSWNEYEIEEKAKDLEEQCKINDDEER